MNGRAQGRGGRSQQSHNKDVMLQAVEAVRQKKMTIREAARKFSLPKSTLADRVSNKHPIDTKMGRRSILTADEEKLLADWIVQMARIGYSRTKNEVHAMVKAFLDSSGRKNPFTDNKPGSDWWCAFCKRNPEINEALPKNVRKERKLITPRRVKQWYEDFERYVLEDVRDPSVLHEPSRLYNANKDYAMQFSLCPKSGEIIAKRGTTHCNFPGNNYQITVLACMSATGHYLRPLIVYPRHVLEHDPLEGFPEAMIGTTDNGWMNAEVFCEWLEALFIPEINNKGVKKPVVLFIDGHSTPISMRASALCKENGVVLYCLLEHATLKMQPCDLGLLRDIRSAWKEAARSFQERSTGLVENISELTFSNVFKEAWTQSATLRNTVNGFRDSGLYPLDPNKVLDYVSSRKSTDEVATISLADQIWDTSPITRKDPVSETEQAKSVASIISTGASSTEAAKTVQSMPGSELIIEEAVLVVPNDSESNQVMENITDFLHLI